MEKLNTAFWILCALISFKGVLCIQSLDAVPTDIEANPEQTAILTCKIRNRRGECIWLKDGVVIGKIHNKYVYEKEPSDGDCSLKIFNTNIESDDGRWQCQVTAASLQEQTLTSREIRLTIREAPVAPKIEDNTNQIQSGDAFKSRSGEARRLHCVSRKGNPAALLKWFIDDQDISHLANQTNATDPDKPKTWMSTSILEYTFHKDQNGKNLRCVAVHAAYDTNSRDIRVRLEVLYPPEIKLEGRPTEDIEEGKRLVLTCKADANPKANIIWRKSGHSGIYNIKETIEFQVIKRTDSGTYSCSAKNDVGESEQLEVKVDVKFRPHIIRVEPVLGATISLYNSTKLVCKAEGNPPPRYSWIQKIGGEPQAWQERGQNSTLVIQNVTYKFQGTYMCQATNVINGVEYKSQSEEITIDVTGAPQVLTEATKTRERVVVEKDEDATINIFFCSDPRPRKTFWEWGSLKLETGSNLVKYRADTLRPDQLQDDCYEARLVVEKADGSDTRKYTLNIENDRGWESYAVALEVREPVAMSVVIGIVMGCIILLVIIIAIVLYLSRSEKLCFNRKHGFRPELDSSDAESGKSDTPTKRNEKPGAIPPDALYCAPKSSSGSNGNDNNGMHHFENFKKRDDSSEGLVYANLEFPTPAPRNERSSGPPTKGKALLKSPPNRTEYAELKFPPPKNKADL